MTTATRTMLYALVTLFVGLPGCGSKLAGLEASAQSAATESATLSVVPVADDASFRLFLAPCDADGCALTVGWVKGAAMLATDALDWGAAGEQDAQIHEDYWVGFAGTATADALTAHTVGEEYNAVTTRIEPVFQSSGVAAALVRQMAGYEHVKRRFYLYVAKGERLTRVWQEAEGTGPFRSDVEVVEATDGTSEIVYIKGFSAAFDEAADELSVIRVQWRAGKNTVEQESMDQVPVVMVSPVYDSVAAARAALSERASCLGGAYWVLQSAAIDGAEVDKFAVAAPVVGAAGATRETARLSACDATIETLTSTLRLAN